MKISERKRRIISVISLCIGLILLFAGIFRGEVAVVFNKASRICMECIGIG
ncbi:MAG: hypothetical protein IJT42_01950 [Treponema sp.]|nr:hypothetical protein [Treponema sp.]